MYSKHNFKISNIARPIDFSVDRLIFTHIPKCGGTSLHRILAHVLGEKYVHIFPGIDWKSMLNEAYAAGGHQRFGENPLHNNGNQVEEKSHYHYTYISMVREPYDRFLSFYWHVQQRPSHHLVQKYPELLGMSPIDFAEFLSTEVDAGVSNIQSRMLSDKSINTPTARSAISNLSQYKLVTTLEDIDVFAYFLRKLLRKPSLVFPQKNIGKYNNKLVYDPIKLRRYIYEINAEDVMLYNHVKKATAKLINELNYD